MEFQNSKILELEKELKMYNVGKTPFLSFAQIELLSKEAQTFYYQKLFDF